mmetsp:Transcript_6326/g.9198  ORF Transcript_6326/g.9198 Transcript_6326/m.9198 type:complete len:252 (+) Transcript_6326:146-901(+)|eukprot:CAMPEP_0195508232 /NCGR_PEP_ID=MMETSP0794_2-20130614/1499_1 /TAXON_ID=515487 /ORGANISM="Stephanopyxis turris, Strain CCMP 815" /LENGTH=251 /DNA_ID=CAMNT_0040635141 /DNA_START=142 /DNA_END=897 /DNA_ORIENTATION=-
MPPNTCHETIGLLGQSEILAEQLKNGSIFKPLTNEQAGETVVLNSEIPLEGYWEWTESASSGTTVAKQDEINRKKENIRIQVEELSRKISEEKEMNRPFSAEEIERGLIEDASRRSKSFQEKNASDPNSGYWDILAEDICENQICFSDPSSTVNVDPALLNAAKNFPHTSLASKQKSENTSSYWDWDADDESGMTIAKQAAIERKRREAIERVGEKCKELAALRAANKTFSVKVNQCKPVPVHCDGGYWDM